MDRKFVKDPDTKMVINRDVNAIQSARERKQAKQLEKQRQVELERDVSALKNDIGEIKDLLRQVLNGNNSA